MENLNQNLGTYLFWNNLFTKKKKDNKEFVFWLKKNSFTSVDTKRKGKKENLYQKKKEKEKNSSPLNLKYLVPLIRQTPIL